MKRVFAILCLILLAGCAAPTTAPSNSAHSRTAVANTVIELPAGDIYVTTPITYYGLNGVTIRGASTGRTTIHYVGTVPVDSIIDMRGAANCILERVTVLNTCPGVYAAVMVSSLPHEGDHGKACTACKFVDVRDALDGGTRTTTVGISVGPKQLYQADGNNDWHEFHGCRFTNYSKAAYRVNGSQAHSLLFDSCQALAYAGGEVGWAFEFGCFAKLHRCAFSDNRIADITMSGHQTSLLVDDCNSEMAGSFLVSKGSGASSFPVTIQGLRWSGDGHGAPFIDYRYPGPLTVARSFIEEGSPDSGMPVIEASNPMCVVRLSASAFACRSEVKGSLVKPWGSKVDAVADACTITRPVGAWPSFKVPTDATKPVK